jgi:hypothetical protein
VVQYGSRAKPVEWEIPSTALRAGSSLRLKNGYAQDDAVVKRAKLHHYPTAPRAFRAQFSCIANPPACIFSAKWSVVSGQQSEAGFAARFWQITNQ